MLAREIRLFFTAWMFFTRIPLPRGISAWVGYSADLLNGAARYFPLVGLAVGAFGALVFAGAMEVFTPLVAVVLSMAATVLFTGAFHEDGFADVCDGFGGASERERVLEIMKDSRIGAFGAIGMLLMLLLKFSALVGLAESGDTEMTAWMMVIGHTLSRAMPVVLIRFLRYVRLDADAKAKPLAEAVSWNGLIAALVFGMLPLLALLDLYDNAWLFCLGIIPVLFATLLMGLWFRRRIGGYTGDCLGATQQVAEVVFYLFVVALLAVPVME